MIGLCSVTFRDKSAKEIIELVKEADLDVIEWGSDVHVPETDKKKAQEVAQLMKEAGLKTSSYGTYYRLGSFEEFEPYIEIAKILGAPTIRVWAGEKGSAETDDKYRKEIIEDAQRIGALAKKENIRITLEYHSDTLTDTPQSAQQLMKEINLQNVLLYWQPAESLSVEQRIESLPKLAPWITNVHIFHWKDFYNRFPLADGFEEWKQYLAIIDKEAPHNHYYLLEFVPDDEAKAFYESAETLKKLVDTL
jgi:sugar phosphate isomerase/epimerase